MALVPMVIMTIGRTAYSWSQNHASKYDFLLYPCLFGISTVFLIRSIYHPKKDEVLFYGTTQGRWNLYVSLAFALVMFFGVNSEIGFVGTLHKIFTVMAIFMAHIAMLGYYKKGVGLHGSIMGSVFGLVGFFLFYFLMLITIAEAEMWTAFPILIWIIGTTKIK